MKRLGMVVVLGLLCGCQPTPPPMAEPVGLKPRPRGYVAQSHVVCTFDVFTIPRSADPELERLLSFTETAGVYGPDRRLMALNGLRIRRSDTRFQKQFAQVLSGMQGGPSKLKTYVRLPEGKEQFFDVGEVLRNETLFVWDTPDSVTGLHFREVRYRMRLSLDIVRANVAELGIVWQALRRQALTRPVSITALDTHVELELGQSVVVAPADVSGRGVGRAFLSGVEEKAVEITFFVITPTEIVEKTPSPAAAGSDGRDTTALLFRRGNHE